MRRDERAALSKKTAHVLDNKFSRSLSADGLPTLTTQPHQSYGEGPAS